MKRSGATYPLCSRPPDATVVDTLDGVIRSLHILCVCTHNRTRSVLTSALLAEHLRAMGVSAKVRSVGVASDGMPATEETVRLLRSRGLDASAHRSRPIRPVDASAADLIVTAEHDHVINLVGGDPNLYLRTFTLPEIVERGEVVGARGHRTIDDWLERVNDGRPNAADYLSAADTGAIAEVDDPTGRTRRHWNVSFREIDDLTQRLAKLL